MLNLLNIVISVYPQYPEASEIPVPQVLNETLSPGICSIQILIKVHIYCAKKDTTKSLADLSFLYCEDNILRMFCQYRKQNATPMYCTLFASVL